MDVTTRGPSGQLTLLVSRHDYIYLATSVLVTPVYTATQTTR